MNSVPTRRSVLLRSSGVAVGFLGLHRLLERAEAGRRSFETLVPDPKGVLDLPPGFRYRILSRCGDPMADGWTVPGQPDGMGAFASSDGRKTLLVCNHEIGLEQKNRGPFPEADRLPPQLDRSLLYDAGSRAEDSPYLGGTTTIVYDHRTGRVERQFLSLLGTDRNCAGGITPWGTWITREEPSDLLSERGRQHGYCFEVQPSLRPALSPPLALRDLGRFRHEAIAVHPSSGTVYLTEDRSDGLLYRFLPKEPGRLTRGGRLQALALRDAPRADTRNWRWFRKPFPARSRLPVRWIDLADIESPDDRLRMQGHEAGAARFARGEGMWYAAAGKTSPSEAIYWCCTNGGRRRLGQVFRYVPSPEEGRPEEADSPGILELFLEPNDSDLLQNGDNLTVAPWGDLLICEDSAVRDAIRRVTPDGRIDTLARNRLNASEFAGSCFSPDGSTLFVNIQTPGITFAITGPWHNHVHSPK